MSISGLRQTHTYAILELSPESYNEIKEKLMEAEYNHVFHENESGTVIDMHGIAVACEKCTDNFICAICDGTKKEESLTCVFCTRPGVPCCERHRIG